MDIQQINIKIEQLISENIELKNKITNLEDTLNIIKNSSVSLDKYLDQISKDIINEVFRKNFTKVSVLYGATFTVFPQSQYMLISGDSAARTSSTSNAISNGSWNGQVLYLEGASNTNTVTIKDTANTQLAGDCTLGLYDTLTVMWNGTYWVELARSNN